MGRLARDLDTAWNKRDNKTPWASRLPSWPCKLLTSLNLPTRMLSDREQHVPKPMRPSQYISLCHMSSLKAKAILDCCRSMINQGLNGIDLQMRCFPLPYLITGENIGPHDNVGHLISSGLKGRMIHSRRRKDRWPRWSFQGSTLYSGYSPWK